MADPLHMIATRVWAGRLRPAQSLVRSGKWTADQADAKLKPWAAIALLCDAPIFEFHVEQRRRPVVFYAGNGDPGRYDHQISAAEARADIARDLCERKDWAPVLADATTAAVNAYEANRTWQTEQAARDLLAICRAFAVTPGATLLLPAQPERMAA